MIRAYRGVLPRIAVSAYIDPSAQVIGDVVSDERSSVWPNATVRGDVHHIRIGDESNVQDNSCLHAEPKVRREATEAERDRILRSAASYVRYRQTYKEESI